MKGAAEGVSVEAGREASGLSALLGTAKYFVCCEEKDASRCIGQAALLFLFTGAIPLLKSTGDLTCSVSDLGRFTPL